MFGICRKPAVALAAAALFYVTPVYLTPALGATITFSDTEFADANWTAAEVLDTSPDNSFSFTAAQSLAGGIPGAYRRVVNTLGSTTPSSIGSGHFQVGAVFDPGEDGTFGSLDMSFRGISLNATAGAMGYGVLVEQGGDYFQVGLGQVLNNTGWASFAGTGLVEGDFLALGGGALDLSDSGSAISIGVIVRNGTFGQPGVPSVNEGGFDNWSVSVHTVEIPAPSAAAILPIALLAFGIARRRATV